MSKSPAALIAVLMWLTTVWASQEFLQAENNEIQFDCSIPHLTDKLPLFSLGKTVRFPSEVLDGILKSAAPGAKLTEEKVNGSLYFYDGVRLAGYFDNFTGETAVFPRLSSLEPTESFRIGDLTKFLKNPAIVPKDDTNSSIVIGSRLDGSNKTFNGNLSPPAGYLQEVLIQRSVRHTDQISLVCGPGTKASFSFAADGSARGLAHRWRPAKMLGSKITPMSSGSIHDRIVSELSAANLTSNVTVRSVDLCFYDSGKRFMQPVFRWNATVSHPFGVSDGVVFGYIPAGGKAPEALPGLSPPKEQVTPTPAVTFEPSTSFLNRQQGGISVGRYVMCNDQYSPLMVADENAFWNGLSATSSKFDNSEYFWDEPFLYESAAASFVDEVNLAFTEGHGGVHYFCTNETDSGWGAVHISSDLPSNGFGPGAGGSLAYWIIRACDTISSPVDYPAADAHQAFDPWWSVFNGMHAVMGYRTLTSVGNGDDGMANVGKVLGLGASAIHGWMTAALSSGKTSAVTVCGHADDNVFQNEDIGRPSCLQIWWYN